MKLLFIFIEDQSDALLEFRKAAALFSREHLAAFDFWHSAPHLWTISYTNFEANWTSGTTQDPERTMNTV